MTIGEVLDPVMLPLAFAVAAIAMLLLVRHVARRYAAAPARIPLRIGIDGRPSKRTAPKSLLWLGPAVMILVVILVGVLLRVDPPIDDRRPVVALALLAIAEAAWLVAWIGDRQIELARKMTFRIAPTRMLRVIFPMLATLAVAIALAVRL